MYSMVLMAAMVPAGDTAGFGKHKQGCNGGGYSAGCTGTVVDYGYQSNSCYGSGSGCYGSSYGCNGGGSKHKHGGGYSGGGLFSKHKHGCNGSMPTYGCSGMSACNSCGVPSYGCSGSPVYGYSAAPSYGCAGGGTVVPDAAAMPKVATPATPDVMPKVAPKVAPVPTKD